LAELAICGPLKSGISVVTANVSAENIGKLDCLKLVRA
jgi:hypothetical protein